MRASELMKEVTKIMEKHGDLRMLIHDSADGCDIFGMSIYADLADEGSGDEDYIAIGIDAGNP